jgi:hypothetical protein
MHDSNEHDVKFPINSTGRQTDSIVQLTHNKTNSSFRQEHNNSWYLTVATCFGLSSDHLQANVHR